MILFIKYRGREWSLEVSDNAKVGHLASLAIDHFNITDDYEYLLYFTDEDGARAKADDDMRLSDLPSTNGQVRTSLVRKRT